MTIERSISAIACLAVAFLISGAAKAECPSFPTVFWWGNLSHDEAVSLVTEKHEGDWSPYVGKWRGHLARAEKTQAMGWAFVIKRDLRLSGVDLDDYVLKVKERVSVITCLAEEDKIRSAEAEGLDTFPTAAGSNGPAPQN